MTKPDGPLGPAHDINFWHWSEDVYAQKGVSALLLQMQDDFGLNVNLLLWSIWTAQHYGEAPKPVIKEAGATIDAWNTDVCQNLRRARRALKTPPKAADNDLAQALRKKVKKAELDAEEIEQKILQTIAKQHFKENIIAPSTPPVILCNMQGRILRFTQNSVSR